MMMKLYSKKICNKDARLYVILVVSYFQNLRDSYNNINTKTYQRRARLSSKMQFGNLLVVRQALFRTKVT